MEQKKEATVIKIRELKMKDRKALTAIFENLIDKVGDVGIIDLIKSDIIKTDAGKKKGKNKNGPPAKQENEKSIIEIGLKVMRLCFKTLENETMQWFSDLLGIEPVDFLEMPLDTEIQIIKQIREAPEVASFFSGASQQFSEIKELFDNYTNKNEASDSI